MFVSDTAPQFYSDADAITWHEAKARQADIEALAGDW